MNYLLVLLFISQIFGVFFSTSVNATYSLHDPPSINPSDSVTIDVNTARNIECRAKKPITWTSELIKSHSENIKILHSIVDINDDEKDIYRSYLIFESITTDYVGYYYCAFNESIESGFEFDHDRKVIEKEASSIYIFVNDIDNRIYQHDVHMIFGKQFESFVIPCKPTSPDVQVELVNESGELFKSSFDQRIGFTVMFTHVEDSGFYDCRIVNDTDEYIQYHVTVIEQLITNYMNKPIITSESNFRAENGSTFTLTCHVEMLTDIPYTIEWTLPSGDLAKNNEFIKLSQIEHEHNDKRKSHQNLTIIDADEARDQGDYKCKVFDFYNNSNSGVQTVEIFEEYAPVITTNFNEPKITPLVGSFLILECSTEGFPQPSLSWYKNGELLEDQRTISLSDENSKLTFHALRLEDSGKYECIAENKIATDKKSVDIEVTNQIASDELLEIMLYIAAAIILFLICVIIYLCYQMRKQKEIISALMTANVEMF